MLIFVCFYTQKRSFVIRKKGKIITPPHQLLYGGKNTKMNYLQQFILIIIIISSSRSTVLEVWCTTPSSDGAPVGHVAARAAVRQDA